jgi:tetratricopeptide (TPR) repeat protein
VIRNYENVLKLNPGNPSARAKLAELLDKSGDTDKAAEHWAIAAENFLAKGDLKRCLEIAERLLRLNPEDAAMRDLRSRAQVQRDSLRLIDGAISNL